MTHTSGSGLTPLPSSEQAYVRGIQLQVDSYPIAGQPTIEGQWPPCRYTLANIETRKGVRQGDKVFQVGFGGGALPLACHQSGCMHCQQTDR